MESRQITIRDYADDTFRITIGAPKENEAVLSALRSYKAVSYTHLAADWCAFNM